MFPHVAPKPLRDWLEAAAAATGMMGYTRVPSTQIFNLENGTHFQFPSFFLPVVPCSSSVTVSMSSLNCVTSILVAFGCCAAVNGQERQCSGWYHLGSRDGRSGSGRNGSVVLHPDPLPVVVRILVQRVRCGENSHQPVSF